MPETTDEFAARLAIALEGNPEAPSRPHGRLTWLKNQLEQKAGLKVSLNTVHKWVHGMSRPREDNIRALARLLKVDEVWLSMGKAGVSIDSKAETLAHVSKAPGAALLVAGMIELEGGKVTFPEDAHAGLSMHAMLGSGSKPVLAVTPQHGGSAKDLTFMIPEPVAKGAKIIGVVHGDTPCCYDLVDLTDLPRVNHGGFSTLTLGRRKDHKFKSDAQRALIPALTNIEEVTA